MLHTQLTEPRTEHSEPKSNPLPDSPIKVNCHKYRRQFELWIDYEVLQSSLEWNDPGCYRLFPDSNHGDPRSKEKIISDLWAYFDLRGDEKGSGYEQLFNCLQHSLKDPSSFKHLGHDSLIKLLNSESEKDFFESDDYICNKAIQEIVDNNINKFIELTDVNELEPFLYEKELLTLYDTAQLPKKTMPEKANHLLTKLLHTKGHRGYIIFFECLTGSVEGRENYHTGHNDIIKEINSGLKSKGLHIGNSTGKRGVPL